MIYRLIDARDEALKHGRDRVLACEDPDQLTACFDRAVVCAHGDDLF